MRRTPTPRIARKRELKTEAVLDAAEAVLEAEGLDGLTLGRVAEAMQLVPAALYRYFSSKDALLAALQRRAVQQIGEQLARSATGDDPLAKLMALAKGYAQLPRRAPHAWHLVSMMLGNPKTLLSVDEAERTAPMLAALLMTVRDGLDEAAEAGLLSRGDAAARTIAYWGALHGVMSLGKLKRYAPQLPAAEAVCELAALSLLQGWGAKRLRRTS